MPGDERVGADTGDDVGRWSTAGRVLPLRRHLPAPLPALAADLYRLSVAQYCQLSRPGNNNNRLTSTTLHTHIYPYNGPLSGTTRVSWYQKGETNLDFTEARDSEWQWHQLGHMQVCTALQTDSHSSTQPLTFLQAGCPSCRPANSVKALKAITTTLLHPFNRLFSRTTWKSKTSLDLYEAGNDGFWGCSDISWTICKFAVKC